MPDRAVLGLERQVDLLIGTALCAAFERITKASEVIVPPTGPGQQPTTQRDEAKFSEQLFLACVVEPVFTEEHIDALRDKSISALKP